MKRLPAILSVFIACLCWSPPDGAAQGPNYFSVGTGWVYTLASTNIYKITNAPNFARFISIQPVGGHILVQPWPGLAGITNPISAGGATLVEGGGNWTFDSTMMPQGNIEMVTIGSTGVTVVVQIGKIR